MATEKSKQEHHSTADRKFIFKISIIFPEAWGRLGSQQHGRPRASGLRASLAVRKAELCLKEFTSGIHRGFC